MLRIYPGLTVVLLSLVLLPVLSPAADTGNVQGVDSEPEEKKQRLGGYKILPIPIFVTEPAIGEGLGVALALFHPVKEGVGSAPRATTPTAIGQMENEQKAPPVITGVFGAYTNSDTWAAGAGHMNNWREDHIRYAGVIAAADVNSRFYIRNYPVKFSLESKLVYQDLKFRLKDSAFFLGMSFSYLDATNSFNIELPDDPPLTLLDKDIRNVGLALRGSYDKRDNTTNPNRGQLVDLSLWRYDEAIGGNYDFWSGKLTALSFHHFYDKLTLGLRLDVTATDGQPPFFSYPWVKLRGIPAMRFQDEMAGAIEVEARYQFAPKWEVLAFSGKGFTDGDLPFFNNPDNIYNIGFGGRYKVIEAQNVWMGLDVAKGPEDWNWYIQVGHAW